MSASDDILRGYVEAIRSIPRIVTSTNTMSNPQTQFAQRTHAKDIEVSVECPDLKNPKAYTLEADTSPIRAVKGKQLQRGKAMARRYLNMLSSASIKDDESGRGYRDELAMLSGFITYKVMTGRDQSKEGAMLSRILESIESEAGIKVESLTYGESQWPREAIESKRETQLRFESALRDAGLINESESDADAAPNASILNL